MKVPESDDLLIHQVLQGETGSFGKLVDRYQHQVYNLALRMVDHPEDARDITQETFIKAFKSLPDFRYPGGFRSWIHRIASNTCLDHLRRRSRDRAGRVEAPGAGGEGLENFPSPGPGPEETLLRREREAAVKKALEGLPESYRLPLLMQHYQKMTYREIAGALDLPEKTVATRLYRAKLMLKELLLTGGECGEVYAGQNKAGGPSGRGVHAL